MARLGIAVVGAGAIGREHMRRLAESETCRLAAIVDPMPAASALAREAGVPHHASLDDLLAAGPKIDGALVATPNELHRPMAERLVEAGIPVLVEKPIASTVADGEALADVSARTGVPILVGHQRRHNRAVQKARAMILEGAIGPLTNITVIATFRKPDDYFDLAWRRQAGGGPVLINLIHEIDLVRFLYGEIESVQAINSNARRGYEVEDSAAIILRLVGGALVSISLSDAAAAPWAYDLGSGELPRYPPQPKPANAHYISGTTGSLTLPNLEHWRYDGVAAWDAPIRVDPIAVEFQNPYPAQLDHFARVIRGEERPLIDAADGARTLAATLAVHEAARSGATVRIDG